MQVTTDDICQVLEIILPMRFYCMSRSEYDFYVVIPAGYNVFEIYYTAPLLFNDKNTRM